MLGFSVFVLLAVLVGVAAKVRNELALKAPGSAGSVVKTRLTQRKVSELPASWDYRPRGLLTEDLNQHIPTYWSAILYAYL